jgi:hypothetical protein
LSLLPEDEDFASVEPLFVSEVELFDSADDELDEESFEPPFAPPVSEPSFFPAASPPVDLRA